MVELPSGQVLLGNEGISAGISNASNTSPITITTGSTDGLSDGETVTISGVAGNTGANGTWTISDVTGTTFQLTGSSGNGSYTGNGSWQSGTSQLIYTPAGSPQNTWRPVITNITNNGSGNFTLTGTQLNGIDEGADYGDDLDSASNYPILQLTTTGGQTLYARTYNWNNTGVATGATLETVQFTLPAGLSLSQVATFSVVANGIASDPALNLNNTDENITIQVDPTDSTMIQALVTNTNTVVATYPNNSPNPIVIVGDPNNNTLTINEANGVINTPISFTGSGSTGAPGDQVVVVGTSGNDSLDLTPTGPSTANFTFDGAPADSFTDINQFSFDAADGNDTMTVDSSASLLDLSGGIFFDGGTGQNSLQLVQTGGAAATSDTYAPTTNPGQGSDIIIGGGITQTVYFQNLAPVYDNVPGPLTVMGTNANDIINYSEGASTAEGLVTVDNFEPLDFTNKTLLKIEPLAGNDTITINDPNTPTGLTGIAVDGGVGSDTLVVNAQVRAITRRRRHGRGRQHSRTSPRQLFKACRDPDRQFDRRACKHSDRDHRRRGIDFYQLTRRVVQFQRCDSADLARQRRRLHGSDQLGRRYDFRGHDRYQRHRPDRGVPGLRVT